MEGQENLDEKIQKLEKEQVEFVRFFFPDVYGRICEFAIPVEEFKDSVEKGKGFDGSSIHGMARIDESDLIAKPDLKTLKVFPWNYEAKTMDKVWKEAVVFADILNPDGQPYEGDSRYVLKKALKKMEAEIKATHFYLGPELEFFLFKANGKGEPELIEEKRSSLGNAWDFLIGRDKPATKKPILMDSGGYFWGGLNGEVRKEVQLILKEMGIKPEYDHHEVAPSQHEIDLRYSDALEMADTLLLWKYTTKRVARKGYGLFASFMAKPMEGINGSGMHVHQSLFKDGKNLFYNQRGEHGLSELALNYLGGLIEHVQEISLVLNPWVNSYKRLKPGYEAPCYITWAWRNRSDLIRVPGYNAEEKAIRFELRNPEPSCNPYLAFALMLNAGMRGIKDKVKPPKPIESNVYHLKEAERAEKGVKSLPANLEEAIKLAQGSKLMENTLGKHLLGKILENAERHLEEHRESLNGREDKGISNYEIEKLLPML